MKLLSMTDEIITLDDTSYTVRFLYFPDGKNAACIEEKFLV